MPEKLIDKTIFSLLEVTTSIQKTLADRYKTAFWVKAEMNKLNLYRHSGHCYPELVEKQGEKVVAQIRSILWKDDYVRINNAFLKILQEPLKDGIKILFLANITFDPVHGLSLRIIDIDPAYTLGDLEREKQETIQRLRSEGIFGLNKTTKLSLLPKRIAIISVESSKGYADFTKVIETNNWNYTFFHMLFPSVLQGEKAIPSITRQLARIKKVQHHFDVVAIIRGGGGDVGLSCYNNYALAKEIALFPLPVITGIGHATNLTVSEMISYENAITPTKIAEYLLQKFHNFAVPVQQAQDIIIDVSQQLLTEQKTNLRSYTKLFRSVVENKLLINKGIIKEQIQSIVQQSGFIFKNGRSSLLKISADIQKDAIVSCKASVLDIENLLEKIKMSSSGFLKNKNLEMEHIQKNITNMSPEKVLQRGYSITLHNGRSINNIAQLQPGDEIKTIISNGEINSTIQTIKEGESS